MNTLRTVALFALAAAGCGGRADPPAAESPLTVERWKSLPPAEKYTIDTFERLKLGEPKLREQRDWDRFAREVIVPARKKELPAGPK